MSGSLRSAIRKIDDYRWEIPTSYKAGMRVPVLIYATEALLEDALNDQSLEQGANVACLPGIVGRVIVEPDAHSGYGFPIGGVGAMRADDGVITPGGIGYDINCGVRLLTSPLTESEVRPLLKDLVSKMMAAVPAGVGSGGEISLKERELDRVLVEGARWAVENGFGEEEDLEVCEESGAMKSADSSAVSARAKKRGGPQLGTLGSGNHFLEIQAVEEVYEPEIAQAMGITHPGQVTVLIHTGSRGLGHQVCDDYLRVMASAMPRYGIKVPDRQLACVPFSSPEGQDYFGAMSAAANFAWANRQIITDRVRDVFRNVFKKSRGKVRLDLVYDVAHNIGKLESYVLDGVDTRLVVHRKGATRAFPAHHAEIPPKYRAIGQPVLIPGDMGRYSYVAVGTGLAIDESFGSTCHGAGRVMSRSEAKRTITSHALRQQLAGQGIIAGATDEATMVEEAPQAYKDVSEVVGAVHGAGVVKKVARMRPLGVVKG